jgi:hypothetical protein
LAHKALTGKMSDFLADIAERSLTTDQAIRPRPLSVFEPFQATGAVGSAQQLRAEQDYRLPESDAVGTVSSMAPVAMTTKELPVGQDEAHTIAVQAPRLSVSAAMAGPQPLAPAIVEQPARQGAYPPAAIQSPPEHALLIETNVPVDEITISALEIRSKPPGESPDGHQTLSPSRPPATEKGINRTGRESGVPGHQSKVAGTISERTLLKPAIERVEMEKSVATQHPQQPIAPLHSRLETAWGNKTDSMQKEKSTPTIHVTIGRIEVRATPAPIQNKPKPRPPDAMSLDEYLRRRNGGGR